MHLGLWLNQKLASDGKQSDEAVNESRRQALKVGASLAGAAILPAWGMASNKMDAAQSGFAGKGRMDFSTGQDWIKAFYESKEKVVGYYADDFVFEDSTLFQAITDKEELTTAFTPFENKDPESPIGLHYFDVIRYDGGKADPKVCDIRKERPSDYTREEYSITDEILLGQDYDYDEWGFMTWIWKGVHNVDFLGLPAAGKTTVTRGVTFHCYKERKIVREFTCWDYRRVAVQLGAAEPPLMFWKKNA